MTDKGSPELVEKAFQERVGKWMEACFTPTVIADKLERADRFIEEALELTQATGYCAERAHSLVDYVFNRPVGEPFQEVGGVMVTLAALCNPHGLDLNAAAEAELARVHTKIDTIRAKQATKPVGKDHATSGRSLKLTSSHPAVIEGRTLFPTTVAFVEETQRVLKSGHNQRKLGKEVTKGRLAGCPIFSLTLQERATCPSSCAHWLSCYGNNMHLAQRVHNDAEFEEVLWLELEALQAKHPDGYLVRLHVLGDFYSEAYVQLWLRALDTFPALNVFGYTARGIESPIGKLLYTAAQARWERFAIRFSGESWREMGAPTVSKGVKHPAAITCPAQTGATACCGTCTLCWSSRKSVAFEQHGKDA